MCIHVLHTWYAGVGCHLPLEVDQVDCLTSPGITPRLPADQVMSPTYGSPAAGKRERYVQSSHPSYRRHRIALVTLSRFGESESSLQERVKAAHPDRTQVSAYIGVLPRNLTEVFETSDRCRMRILRSVPDQGRRRIRRRLHRVVPSWNSVKIGRRRLTD
jgi:hypothetical protein